MFGQSIWSVAASMHQVFIFLFMCKSTAILIYRIYKGVEGTWSRMFTSTVNTLYTIVAVRKEEYHLTYEGQSIMKIFTDFDDYCLVPSVSFFFSLVGINKITSTSMLSLHRGRPMKKTRSH